MLWLKAFHIISVVAWFAGLFYLPRLFVYHADTNDTPGLRRFEIMERRLFALMSIGAVASVAFGVALVAASPVYLKAAWLHAKLALVALLIGYHLYCYRLLGDFAHQCNTHSAKWYRLFNEVPSLFLLAIVLLVVLKPF